MFDGLLFSASNLLFIVADPVFAILVGHDFPRVFDTFYSGNSVGNLSGLLVTTFCLCFFGGRLFIRSNKTRTRTDKRLLPLPNAIKPHVIVIAVSIAITAYLANGGGFSVENLLKTLVARSSGYVAFASAGFGTQNPVIVLLAQCIPATIILLLLNFRRGAYFANFFTVLVVLLLFGLFALSGGRRELF